MLWHLGSDDSTLDPPSSVLLSWAVTEHTTPDRQQLCKRAADALAEHLTGLQQQARACLSAVDIAHACDTMQFVVDELVDNALKYRAGAAITVKVTANQAAAHVEVTNQITDSAVAALLTTLTSLTAADIDLRQRLHEQVLANVAQPRSNGAGLGYLTLILDHRVSLSWHIEQTPDHNAHVVTVAHFLTQWGEYDGDKRRQLPGLV